ncbi:MAG TPA: phenylalanine--tRNA ligase subunit alpha [Thermoplasmata archaeon]|nr:phenylalanine--tRNA ligase subunit alpha [Thermoplasmata archaeon]
MADEDDEPGPAPGAVTLSEPELAVLSYLRGLGERAEAEPEVVEAVGGDAATVRGSLQRLRSKRLAVVEERPTPPRVELTPRGAEAIARGLPERRLLDFLTRAPGAVAPEEIPASVLSAEERSAAIGLLRRSGLIEPAMPLRRTKAASEERPELADERTLRSVASPEGAAESFDPEAVGALARRGLVRVIPRSTRLWGVSEEGRRLVLPDAGRSLVGALTPALLRDGASEEAVFRPYDVRAPVPFVTGARPHPYLAWLRNFEEVLLGLGFEEARGPLLETEFWNGDVLFMPQEHPARSIHDVLSLTGVQGHPPDAALLARVAAVHEGRPMPGDRRPVGPGWRSPYDRAVAARPVLRSQTTAVSARFLAQHPKPPFRVYCIDRNFRRDAVDATHHVEFEQCEGILGAPGTSLRHLVGVFRALAHELRLGELKIRPSYFPFTEPSIEGYIRHPQLGWIEVFPGGMFRPEVLRPLGVEVPVAAWGIGVMRLALVALGVNDIREIFADDLGRLRGESG